MHNAVVRLAGWLPPHTQLRSASTQLTQRQQLVTTDGGRLFEAPSLCCAPMQGHTSTAHTLCGTRGRNPTATMAADPPRAPEADDATNLSTCLLVVLVTAWCLAGHGLASRHWFLTEGSAACGLGLLTGVVLLIGHRLLEWQVVTTLLEFNAAGFFTYLLPPIILHAGLSVERAAFFTNLPSILSYGILGTLASCAIISTSVWLLGLTLFKFEDCLALGAIFAATDSVATMQVLDRDANPSLFALVFGEGVVNDAVSVVLLGAVSQAARGSSSSSSSKHVAGGVVLSFSHLLVTSLLLGAGAGLAIAAALKHLQLKGAHQELSVIVLLSYASYLLADICGLSAILSLFVCGVVVSHYALHNVSAEGRAVTLSSCKTAAHIAEGVTFIYVGLDSLDPLKWQAANALEACWLVVVLAVLLVVSRAACVVPLSLAHNVWSAPSERLGRREVVTVWWAGTMRGAVSIALVYQYFDDDSKAMQDRHRATLIVTTLTVVMLSILGCGALTKPLLAALYSDEQQGTAFETQLGRIPLLGHIAHSASDSSLAALSGGDTTPAHHSQQRQPAALELRNQAMQQLGHAWGRFDHTVMKPVFGGPQDEGGGRGS